MKDINEYIGSGILEAYVLGATNLSESREVEKMMLDNHEIRQEVDSISEALENYAFEHAQSPDQTIRPFLIATIDYMERMRNGESPSDPPILSENSKIADYIEWLNRDDMNLPEDHNGLHAKIIAHTPQALTAIVWIQHMAPQEVHDDEFEKFLIVEGTCDITIANDTHHLKPGDYLSIPLYKNHQVVVTSDIPCKVILQRVAA